MVIVTGASSGIGRATARAFADAGDLVLAVGRRQDELTATSAGYPSMRIHVGDLRDPAEPRRTVEAALGHWGRLDVLVNNAGIFAQQPIEAIDADEVQALLAINLVAPSLLVREAAPRLAPRRGVVVNVSSTLGSIAAPGASLYGASKAALDHATRSWAVELAALGVRVNAVAPGPTESGALAAAGMSEHAIEEVKTAEVAAIPLGRRGTPEDVAAWVLALAGGGGAWVTGQVVGVDGGLAVA